MIYAEKGNRVRQIAESEIQKYVEQGYTITDGRGTVIKETVPTDLNSLKLAYLQHTGEINALKEQIAHLQAELAEAKKPAKKEVKAETPSEETPSPAPKRGRTAKTAE